MLDDGDKLYDELGDSEMLVDIEIEGENEILKLGDRLIEREALKLSERLSDKDGDALGVDDGLTLALTLTLSDSDADNEIDKLGDKEILTEGENDSDRDGEGLTLLLGLWLLDGLNDIDKEMLLLSDPVAEILKLSLKLILELGDCELDTLTDSDKLILKEGDGL